MNKDPVNLVTRSHLSLYRLAGELYGSLANCIIKSDMSGIPDTSKFACKLRGPRIYFCWLHDRNMIANEVTGARSGDQ